jgi:hypothetical protein
MISIKVNVTKENVEVCRELTGIQYIPGDVAEYTWDVEVDESLTSKGMLRDLKNLNKLKVPITNKIRLIFYYYIKLLEALEE